MNNIKKLAVKKSVYSKDRQLASELRKQFKLFNIKVFNVMGSIGAGKTSLLEILSRLLIENYPVLVINGDLSTNIDADRIKRSGATSIQINTGKGCHLDARWIKTVIDDRTLLPNGLEPFKNGIIFIENVGNLICPAEWDVGADLNIVVTSITEGPYHVKKHPIIFKVSNLAIINKIDTVEIMEVDPEQLKNDAIQINPKIKVCFTSYRNNSGITELKQLLLIL